MSDTIDIMTKLFDTLKDASNRNENATDKLIAQQLELVSNIKDMPIDELRKALKDHATQTTKDMDECSGAIELKTGDIMNELRIIKAKITKMLIVVGVVVSVATGGYFLIRYAADYNKPIPTNWEERLEQIEQDQHEDFNKRLDQMMNEIRKEMQRLHSEDP